MYTSHAFFYSIVHLVPKVKRKKEFAIIVVQLMIVIVILASKFHVILDCDIQELEMKKEKHLKAVHLK